MKTLTNRNRSKVIPALLSFVLVVGMIFSQSRPVGAVRNIMFPVAGGGSYGNDYNSPRDNGIHAATDIMGSKMQKLVAAVDGTVTFVAYPQPSYGYMVQIKDSEGYKYNYIHINNDTPGTDDGNGGPMNAYAPDMKNGNKVSKGQLIGYMGDSGNAETTAPHLHFEILDPNGNPTNPYDSLRQAAIIPTPFTYPEADNELLPFTSSYGGKVNISKGQYDLDNKSELVVAAGAGGGPHVKVYKDKTLISEFFAYDPAFRGGVDVASGDVDGDGIDEIITAAGPGGGPHVRILRLSGAEYSSFYAYDPAFGGGVSVAAGDVDGDGKDEIITGPGAGGGPHMKVFKPNGVEVTSWFAYDPAMRSGLDVASGDVLGDTKDEIITAAGPGGGPHVMVFDINRTVVGAFYAYDQRFTGGVRVAVGDVVANSPKSEIVTVPAGPGGPHARIVNVNGANINNKIFLEEWWDGYYDIASGGGDVFVSTGENRRGSIREVF